MSWGSQQWGVDPFGGIPVDLTVSHAYAISTNEIVVVLSKAPLDRSAFLSGDVRNPQSWEVSIPDTAALLNVAGIAAYDQPLSWLVRTLERLPDSTVTCRVKATSLKAANGQLVSSPDYAEFMGVTEVAVATPTAQAATRQNGGRDLANLPAPTSGDSTSVSGTLVIKGGDYALVEGQELLRKLMYRRIMTTPGEFFHLPTYGCGLKVKQPIPVGDLVKLKATIERQIKLERDVVAVNAAVAQSMNKLTIQVKARLAKSGQVVTVAMNTPIGQG